MTVTVYELRRNLGKYLSLSAAEDVCITRNGKTVAKLTSPFRDREKLVESLTGVLPRDLPLEKTLEERLNTV